MQWYFPWPRECVYKYTCSWGAPCVALGFPEDAFFHKQVPWEVKSSRLLGRAWAAQAFWDINNCFFFWTTIICDCSAGPGHGPTSPVRGRVVVLLTNSSFKQSKHPTGGTNVKWFNHWQPCWRRSDTSAPFNLLHAKKVVACVRPASFFCKFRCAGHIHVCFVPVSAGPLVPSVYFAYENI